MNIFSTLYLNWNGNPYIGSKNTESRSRSQVFESNRQGKRRNGKTRVTWKKTVKKKIMNKSIALVSKGSDNSLWFNHPDPFKIKIIRQADNKINNSYQHKPNQDFN